MADESLLEMKGISKQFPGVQALDNVDFSVRAGEVHALVGENGAGKSTLMKILGGAYQADQGNLYLNGIISSISSPSDGIQAGINVVYQELVLAPHLSVAENIMLGQQPKRSFLSVDWSATRKRAREVLKQLGVEIDVRRTVRSLTVAEQQIVEIARALQRKSRILILDEPSAVLGKRDIDLLYKVIRRLKEQGIAIIYISHRLEEIFLIADRVTILKDGKIVGTAGASELDEQQLVKMMIGRELKNVYQKSTTLKTGNEVIRVEGLTKSGVFENISFAVRSGEILGMAGLVGSGRTDIVRAIAGADKFDSGSIFLNEKRMAYNSPSEALSHGVSLLPEDRNTQGLFLKRPLYENITIASLDQIMNNGVINLKKERVKVNDLIHEIEIQAASINQLAANLSGGNKQKVVLARWLGAGSKVLIFDEPTRGVDVGAKVEIYRLMNQLAEEGAAIIMVSSEMPEILGMADNILVIWRGKISASFSREEATDEKILQFALFGANNNGK
jgi:ribose transport system ATP-binding protein